MVPKIAGILLGIGVLLWGVTVLANRAVGRGHAEASTAGEIGSGPAG